jgi:hypothetical protein
VIIAGKCIEQKPEVDNKDGRSFVFYPQWSTLCMDIANSNYKTEEGSPGFGKKILHTCFELHDIYDVDKKSSFGILGLFYIRELDEFGVLFILPTHYISPTIFELKNKTQTKLDYIGCSSSACYHFARLNTTVADEIEESKDITFIFVTELYGEVRIQIPMSGYMHKRLSNSFAADKIDEKRDAWLVDVITKNLYYPPDERRLRLRWK